MLLVGLGGAGLGWVVHDLPPVEGLTGRAAFASTRILDRNGKLLYELFDPQGGQRTLVALAGVPQVLRDATISTEDNTFYSNPGLDAGGLLRALWANLTSGQVVAGGSTITQQLARAVLLSPEEAGQRTLGRKIREAVLAYEIDGHYSKDAILEMYLNQIYYGNVAYGVEAASRAYFGKSVRDLDLAEAALLAGLPQAPSQYDPLTAPDAARARQRDVLDGMVHTATSRKPRPTAPPPSRCTTPPSASRSPPPISSCTCAACWKRGWVTSGCCKAG